MSAGSNNRGIVPAGGDGAEHESAPSQATSADLARAVADAAALVHVPNPTGVVSFGPFGERGTVVYTPPRDTMDPRYEACTDHHVACDCREAHWAEDRREYRAESALVQAAFDQFLGGHPARTYDDSSVPCQCTGCQIARAINIYPKARP